KVLEAQNLERRQEAEAVGAKMSDLKVILIRQASEALQLYGSVTSRDIADAAAAAGVKIERGQVALEKPIKSLGAHKIKVHLHPEVTIDITAVVARSPDEAEFLAKGGTLVAETERAQLQGGAAAPRARPARGGEAPGGRAPAGRRAVGAKAARRRGRRGSRRDRGRGRRKEVRR